MDDLGPFLNMEDGYIYNKQDPDIYQLITETYPPDQIADNLTHIEGKVIKVRWR